MKGRVDDNGMGSGIREKKGNPLLIVPFPDPCPFSFHKTEIFVDTNHSNRTSN